MTPQDLAQANIQTAMLLRDLLVQPPEPQHQAFYESIIDGSRAFLRSSP